MPEKLKKKKKKTFTKKHQKKKSPSRYLATKSTGENIQEDKYEKNAVKNHGGFYVPRGTEDEIANLHCKFTETIQRILPD